MNFTALDRFVEKFPFLFDFLRVRITAFFKTTPTENICFPVAAVFACGILNWYGSADWLCIAAFVIMLLSWILSSLLSGFLKRWYFIIYCAAFNLLPHLFINTAEREADSVNEILAFISRLVTYGNAPLINMGADSFVISAVISGGSLLFMFIGFYFRKNLKKSRAYCKIRLNMLDSDKK